ncbi:AfsR/SARP family transcriptional regulator [Salinactinospora qingdaonensis]|uniref:OmpR/PhoB-type domain-containing protein n=1 Tax=Salinactinospora qingdaonensis TaxID=702744 RepID=A0ABP7G5R0_9ACTN
MDIQLLGMFSVRVENRSVVPTAVMPRRMMALLASHANKVVPISSLCEELWEERFPRSMEITLQTYVFHLRTLINSALGKTPPENGGLAKNALVARPGGYLLDTLGGTIDAAEFDRLAEAGRHAREAGNFSTASRRFNEALALWKGPPLTDVQVGPVLEAEAVRLHRSHLNLLESRVDVELRMGRHREMVRELTAMVERYRTHEGLSAHLMIAFYRSGRQREAIEVFRRLRFHLLSELGVEPSPQLQRLRHLILTRDTRLKAPCNDVDRLTRT